MEFFEKIEFNQLDALVTDEKYIFSEEIERLNIPSSLKYFFTETKKISFKKNYEHLPDDNKTTEYKNLTRITSKKSYEIQKLIPLIKDLCEKHNCKYLIDIGSGLVK